MSPSILRWLRFTAAQPPPPLRPGPHHSRENPGAPALQAVFPQADTLGMTHAGDTGFANRGRGGPDGATGQQGDKGHT